MGLEIAFSAKVGNALPGTPASIAITVTDVPFATGDDLQIATPGEAGTIYDLQYGDDFQGGAGNDALAQEIVDAINTVAEGDLIATRVDNVVTVKDAKEPITSEGNLITIETNKETAFAFAGENFTGGIEENAPQDFKMELDEEDFVTIYVAGTAVAKVPFTTTYEDNKNTFQYLMQQFLKKANN